MKTFPGNRKNLQIENGQKNGLPSPRRWGLFWRVGKYSLFRLLELSATLLIGVFIVVIVLNQGGYIDEIYRANIWDIIRFNLVDVTGVTPEEWMALVEEMRTSLEHAYGLDQPFLLRCLRWTGDALALNMGDANRNIALSAEYYTFFYGYTPTMAEGIILGPLPFTLVLFGTSNFLFFFASLFAALFLYRRFEGFWDRLVVFLSPVSSIPSWLYGVFLVIVFAALIPILPFPKEFPLNLLIYIQSELHAFMHGGASTQVRPDMPSFFSYMVLPVVAIFLNLFFQSAYTWRTFFLMHSGEDYIELAKAKGLSNNLVERRYLLRPALPYIMTSLAMTLVGTWQNAIILEKFFFWPGIGKLFFDNIYSFRVTGSIVVMFAYLLMFTVFILDILYAIVDPRVRIGSDEHAGAMARPPLRERMRSFFIRRPRERLPARYKIPPLTEEQRQEWKLTGKIKHTSSLASAFKEIRRYPSAIVGLVIIAMMVGLSLYTVIAIPYNEAISLWRGDDHLWANNPAFAQPAWSNFFRVKKQPETIIMNSDLGEGERVVEQSGDMKHIVITFPFSYPYDGFPQDLVVNISAAYTEKLPLVVLSWVTTDGREIALDRFIPTSDHRYSFEYENTFTRQAVLTDPTGGLPWDELFVEPGADPSTAMRGEYQVRVEAFVFEPDSDVNAEMVLYGQVYGLAGTDNLRRDLSVAILWGTPFSLTFGLLGAVGTGVLAMVIAAMGVWFGGWVDRIIQHLTEINLLLPALPIAIMIYFLYTHNIWVILGIIIILSVFGNALKNYRAAFLQIRESGYVQAALVYGAGNWRVILRYLVPRILPLLVPQLVALVPSYIFLEPTLAFVGIVDPYLPTWGKVLMTGLYVARQNNQIFYMTLMRNPYLALEPIGLMFVTGLAFSLLGMALDRIFNPRLRTM